jgi:hypothetical protein
MRPNRTLRLLVGVVAAVVALAASFSSYAQDGGSPLTLMGGAWSGAGSISLSDGSRERIRCRSNYQPDASGATMRLVLTCASDSYKFDLSGNVSYNNGQISGSWSEASRNAAGNITGTARGGQIEARAEGQTFAAFLSISTRGDRQSVSIRAPGSTMQEVAITLNRSK